MTEHGGRFRRTAVLSVDTERRTLSCTTGPDERYDALVIAVGASARPAFEHALTFGADVLACDEVLADLEHERAQSVAFVIPEDCTWPLPLYELALATADGASGTRTDEVRLHLVTPERRALELFGTHASAAVTGLLRSARIALHCDVGADVRRGGHVDIGLDGTLAVDRVVALAHLEGPRLAGLPTDARGFIPVDEHGRVTERRRGLRRRRRRPTARSSTAGLPASRPTPSLPMSQLQPARRWNGPPLSAPAARAAARRTPRVVPSGRGRRASTALWSPGAIVFPAVPSRRISGCTDSWPVHSARAREAKE